MKKPPPASHPLRCLPCALVVPMVCKYLTHVLPCLTINRWSLLPSGSSRRAGTQLSCPPSVFSTAYTAVTQSVLVDEVTMPPIHVHTFICVMMHLYIHTYPHICATYECVYLVVTCLLLKKDSR